ncbi:hypothetical protein, partial [Enterococcus faecium]|uniref:hypothetical protein n=2 Tax=Enterococcus TaxID=1350 RepID=UPI0034E936DA
DVHTYYPHSPLEDNHETSLEKGDRIERDNLHLIAKRPNLKKDIYIKEVSDDPAQYLCHSEISRPKRVDLPKKR